MIEEITQRPMIRAREISTNNRMYNMLKNNNLQSKFHKKEI